MQDPLPNHLDYGCWVQLLGNRLIYIILFIVSFYKKM